MTSFPLVTKELVRRIVADYGDDRIRMFQEVPGNPYAIDIQHFGHVLSVRWCRKGSLVALG